MSASKSHLTPAQVFGERLRELRQRRGWNQRELAERAHVDRTTVNKIEQGGRSDVSISQLFTFAEVLDTSPINLLTPGVATAQIEVSAGGRVLSGLEARRWIRGDAPAPDADPLDYFLDLPIDEQRDIIGSFVASARESEDPIVGVRNRLWWSSLQSDEKEAFIAPFLERLYDARKEKP
jgi:transcriptional regulator with XRE-family HTH domain